MKKTAAYSCFIVLTRQGFVFRSNCGCPAGIDGRCNHIAATLFALEVFCKTRTLIESQSSEAACTSQACKWNIQRKRKGDVVPISKTKFYKHKYGKNKKERVSEVSQDVRPAHNRSFTNTKLYNILTKVEKFQDETGNAIGFGHILKQTTEKQLLESIHHDNDYCAVQHDQDKHSNENELLSPIKVQPITLSELLNRCEKVSEALKVSNEDVVGIESSTRN